MSSQHPLVVATAPDQAAPPVPRPRETLLRRLPGPTPPVTPVSRPHRPIRRASRASRTAAADLATILLTVTGAVASGIGGVQPADRLAGAVTTAVALVGALALVRSWSPEVVGRRAEEFRRLGQAVLVAGGVLAAGGLAASGVAPTADPARTWALVVVPATGVLLGAVRLVRDRFLRRCRRRGVGLTPVLAVGPADAVADLVRRARTARGSGWEVTGVCTPTATGTGPAAVEDVPVLGDQDDAASVALSHGHHVVVVCRSAGAGPAELRRLAWSLEDTPVELVVDAGLVDVTARRASLTDLDGLPLLRLPRLRLDGAARTLKHTFDRVAALSILLLTAPLLLVVALAVRCGDGGPVFFRQERIGVRGRPFDMVKFRTMVPDAPQLRAGLHAVDEGAGPLFKMRRDPRVTRVGAVLRRYSLDELPQLFNVVGGSMSLVGPRPPLPGEVATYCDRARRRLLVRPGMTGLWQVSGRSTLSWEESLTLDLRYVETWSLSLDLIILVRTVRAVLRGDGAW